MKALQFAKFVSLVLVLTGVALVLGCSGKSRQPPPNNPITKLSQVEQEILGKAKTLGIPMMSIELKLPEPQPSENAAPIVLEIKEGISSTKDFDQQIRRVEETAENRALELAELAPFASILEASEPLVQKPLFRPERNWAFGAFDSFEESEPLRVISQLAAYRAEARCLAGDLEGSMRDFRLAFHASNLLYQEQIAEFVSFGNGCFFRTLTHLRRAGLKMSHKTEVLKALRQSIPDPKIPPLRSLFEMDAFLLSQTLSYNDQSKRGPQATILEGTIPSDPNLRKEYMVYLDFINSVIEVGDSVKWDARAVDKALISLYKKISKEQGAAYEALRTLPPLWRQSIASQVIAQTHVNISRCALDMWIYRNGNSKPLRQISDLGQEYPDPYVPGQFLKLGFERAKPFLYSVGFNGVDDQGKRDDEDHPDEIIMSEAYRTIPDDISLLDPASVAQFTVPR